MTKITRIVITVFILCVVGFSSFNAIGQSQSLVNKMHHLRNTGEREWSEFAPDAEGKDLVIEFTSGTKKPQTLELRQYNVKLNWTIKLNEQHIGSLVTDEKELVSYFRMPPAFVQVGKNTLEIKCTDERTDDIRLGHILIDTRPVDSVLNESSLEIEVIESGTGLLLPSHLTIINSDAVLQTLASPQNRHLAIRPGHVYTSTGKATLRMPSGLYRIYAGHGFEYGIDEVEVMLEPGVSRTQKFFIKREVNTDGWISCDTHIHTVTHSHHGDATELERAITLAAEGIELPVVTEHNQYIDLKPVAEQQEVEQYFTPVIGNEVTTAIGHFNIFPMTPDDTIPDHHASNWTELSDEIRNASNPKVIILNHGRDIHEGFRPFDSTRFSSWSGIRMDQNHFFPNAMEVINTGSQQTDVMRLFNDWFALLNHGYTLTPVGASDSHDVSRFIVGQGRTYIQGKDGVPSSIDIDETIRNFKDGKVLVSAGLLTRMTVNGKYGAGDLVPWPEALSVSLEVLGPSWVNADKISLYANGVKIKEEKLFGSFKTGLKWEGRWEIELPRHDVYLVAIAEGPGDDMPFWPIAQPYQPTSIEWKPRLIGSTGVIWIDADKDGKKSTAFDYAKLVTDQNKRRFGKIVKALDGYDETVAIQVAALLYEYGVDLRDNKMTKALAKASASTKSGFEKVIGDLYRSTAVDQR